MWDDGGGGDGDDEDEMIQVVRRIVGMRGGAGNANGNANGNADKANDDNSFVEDFRAALMDGQDDGKKSTKRRIDDAVDRLAKPLMIPAAIHKTLRESKLLGDDDEEDEDDGIWHMIVETVIRPIVRVVVWLRTHFIRPVVLVIPEWLVVIYLVGRSVAVGMVALRVKAMRNRKDKFMNSDLAFANIYAASAVVFGVLTIVLFAILAGRSVSTAVIAVVLSSAGVLASVLIEQMLRMADAPTFVITEASEVASERRAMFLHGGAGLAFSAIVTSIPACCPF